VQSIERSAEPIVAQLDDESRSTAI
jgi:hypothetical protein